MTEIVISAIYQLWSHIGDRLDGFPSVDGRDFCEEFRRAHLIEIWSLCKREDILIGFDAVLMIESAIKLHADCFAPDGPSQLTSSTEENRELGEFLFQNMTPVSLQVLQASNSKVLGIHSLHFVSRQNKALEFLSCTFCVNDPCTNRRDPDTSRLEVRMFESETGDLVPCCTLRKCKRSKRA